MKYYIGTLCVVSSTTEQMSPVCIAAANEAQANALLEQSAANYWCGEPGMPCGERSYHWPRCGRVTAASVKEVSPVTFEQMRELLPTVGDTAKLSIEQQDDTEQTRTLALRLGNQLKRLGCKVSHGKLLHAVAASLGDTDWQVLKTRAQRQVSRMPEAVASADEPWLPNGNWPTTPLRDAETLAFMDRVNAIWLTHGDVRLAAKLLHVDPQALMGSFHSAGEADVAFCSRSPDWKPEDSLAPDFAQRCEEGRTFRVEVTAHADGHHELQGYVGDRRVIQMDNRLDRLNWNLGMSSCLPNAFWEAKRVQACIDSVFRQASELTSQYCSADTQERTLEDRTD